MPQSRTDISSQKPSSKVESKQPAEKAFAAGVIVFRKTKEGIKFLVMYHRGTYWNFPKGSIEKGETSVDAALRELREETGLKDTDIKIHNGFKVEERFQFNIGKRKIQKTVILYLGETSKKSVDISNGRHEEGFGWFLFRDANKILSLHQESRTVLRKANNFIKGRSNSRRRQNPASKKHYSKKRPQPQQRP